MPHAHAMCRLLAKLAVPPRRWKRPKLPQLAAPPEERVRCAAAESPAAGRGGGWRGADGGQVSVEGAAIEHYAARGWPVRGVVRRAGRVRRAGAIAARRVHLRVRVQRVCVCVYPCVRVLRSRSSHKSGLRRNTPTDLNENMRIVLHLS